MQKKLIFITLGTLFLLADLFGSILFISGKSPVSVLGFGTPKITITPFPTMVLENLNSLNASSQSVIASNISEGNVNIDMYGANISSQNLVSGQKTELVCRYRSDRSLSTKAELYLLAQSNVANNTYGKNESFFLKNLTPILIQVGDNQTSVVIDNTSLIPSGKYEAILNIYGQNSNQILTNCVSGQFSFSNNNPFVLTSLSTQDNKVSQLSGSEQLNFNIHSFGNFQNLKARVIVNDMLLKANKVLYVKDLNSITLETGVNKNLTADLSDFPLKGIYMVYLELTDQKGKVVSSSPLQAFYSGLVPQINAVTTKSQGSEGYSVEIKYSGETSKGDNSLEIYALVCAPSGCDSSNWTDLSGGWPASLFVSGKQLSQDKNKITIKVRLKNSFQSLINYHN